MKIGRVCGTVVSTIQSPFLDGRRLLMVEILNPDRTSTGREIIAVAAIDAGIGDDVLLLDEGNSARQILDLQNAPIRTLVVGIIDEINEDPVSGT